MTRIDWTGLTRIWWSVQTREEIEAFDERSITADLLERVKKSMIKQGDDPSVIDGLTLDDVQAFDLAQRDPIHQASLDELPRLGKSRIVEIDERSNLHTGAMEDFVGWPMRAMYADQSPLDGPWRIENGIQLFGPRGSYSMSETPTLPLIPMITGFALNTTFYSVLWFGCQQGLVAQQRLRRRRRGHCPKCGYDLLGDFVSGCPEFGWGRA